MALTADEKFNCLGCDSNDRNIYVDDILSTLIKFLCAATCIPWVRSHENIDRPDLTETGERMGQYGVVEIINSSRDKTYNPARSNQVGDGSTSGNIVCYTINSERELTVQLDIYRERGEKNRNQESSTIVQPVGAGIDHLERLKDIWQINRIKAVLKQKGIIIKEFSDIEWNKEIVKNTWENIGEMQIVINVCAQSSIADALIKCIEFKFCDKDAKELCKKFEPECN